MLDSQLKDSGEFGTEVTEARHLGEITLVTLPLTDVSGMQRRLTLSGPQRLRITVGVALRVCAVAPHPEIRIDDAIHIALVATVVPQFHPTGLTRLTK
ncbi:hypothetical protein [Cupriavidus sp. 8B]